MSSFAALARMMQDGDTVIICYTYPEKWLKEQA